MSVIFRPKKYLKWIAISSAFFLIMVLLMPLPDPLFNQGFSTVLEAREGELLGATVADDGQWRFPPLVATPEKFEKAVLMFEDEYFYWHPGINPISFLRAIKQNIQARRIVSGGSTLSMQVVRMAAGNQHRSWPQKLYETLLSLKLEIFYSKKEIIAMYASHAPFGGNVVGLNAAAWRYFGRSPEDLSWAESASLAVLPNRPSSIFPGRNENIYTHKRNKLLDKLCAKGVIDPTTAKLGKTEEVPTRPRRLPVLAQRLLFRATKEGKKGQTIASSIDFDLQKRVKELVKRHSQRMSGNEIYNAAAIVVRVSDGQSLAYVGNTYNDEGDHGQEVDVITANRSTGSLLKPILYALAMDEGMLMPQELLPDIPIFYKGFVPKNFDKKFQGAIKADEALARSRNIPFVFLLRDYGYEKFHQKLKQFGMTSLNFPPSHYGLTLILGGAESSLWDMTAMYAGMVRAYTKYPYRNYRYTEMDYHPNTYLSDPSQPEIDTTYYQAGIVNVGSIWHMVKAMKQLRRPDERTGWELFGSARSIAWKTGTSYGFRDGWAIGFTKDHVVGVWIGNADGEGRPGLTGVRAAAPLMFNIFDAIGEDDESDFVQPRLRERPVCAKSGLIATELCDVTTNEALPDYMIGGKRCDYHQLVFLDKSKKHQVNSSCYSLAEAVKTSWFMLPPVQSWYYRNYDLTYYDPPLFNPECQHAKDQSVIDMIYPRQFTKVYVPKEQNGDKGRVVFEAAHKQPKATLFWHLDNTYVGATSGTHQMALNPTTGSHIISLIDENGNTFNRKFEVLSK